MYRNLSRVPGRRVGNGSETIFRRTRAFLGARALAPCVLELVGICRSSGRDEPDMGGQTCGSPTLRPGEPETHSWWHPAALQPTPFHFFFPTPGVPGAVTIQSGHGDPSLIFDFDGMVGVAEVGLGQGTSTLDGRRLFWAADARFMKGTYIGTDGDTRTGAFAFL